MCDRPEADDVINQDAVIVETDDQNVLRDQPKVFKEDHRQSPLTDRSDSGMDEESFLTSHSQELSDDSEDEVLVHRKQKSGKKKMIIDDDDDEEEEENEKEGGHLEGKCPTSPVESNNSSAENEIGSAGEDDEEENKPLEHEPSQSSPRGPPPSQDESDDDNPVEKFHLSFQNDDLYEADSGDENEAPHESFTLVENEEDKTKEHSDRETNNESDEERMNSDEDNSEGEKQDDEGFVESQLDPSLLAKLKKMKGAAKSAKQRAKYERKSKPSADQMLELYSESQRLQRGSRVNLPYHEPEAKSLDDFLARAAKKKQEYAALRRPKDIQKAKIISEKLSVQPPRLPSTLKSKKLSEKASSSQESSLVPAAASLSPSLPTQQAQTNSSSLEDSGMASQSATQQSEASTVVLSASQIEEELGEDELPDLDGCVNSQVPSSSSHGLSISKECVSNTSQLPTDTVLSEIQANEHTDTILQDDRIETETCDETSEGASNKEQTHCISKPSMELEVPSLQRDPSKDLFRSQSTVGDSDPAKCPTGQSLDTNPSLDLFSSDPGYEQDKSQGGELEPAVQAESLVIQETPQEDDLTSTLTSETCDDKENKNVCEMSSKDLLTDSVSSQVNSDTPVDSSEKKDKTPSKKSILEKLKGIELPELPVLNRTRDDVICLDEEEDNAAQTPKNPGLQMLMERLAKHSKKKVAKPAYDVDISIVEKEGTEGNKEELKLKSFTYHVEEEESPSVDCNSGSKLTLLKQQLGVGMRKKREEARQRRQKLYALENEEGFTKAEDEKLLEEEDEAEMTDKSETDDEEEDEEEFQLQFGKDDESDDGKDYNPLLDTEAQDDDDEDDKYSDFEEDSNDVHLHFDVSDDEAERGDDERDDDEEEETTTKPASKKKKKKPNLSDDSLNGDESDEDIIEKAPEKDPAASLDSWTSEMTPMTRLLQDTQTQEKRKYLRESSRSPDLYSQAPESESNSNRTQDLHNESSLSVCSFNPHSQMLDADGYLKLAQTQKPRESSLPFSPQEDAVDGSGMDFGGSSMKMTPGAIFQGVTSQKGDSNMKDLLALCSGSFGKEDSVSEDAFPLSQKRSQGFSSKLDENEDNSRASFYIFSDAEEEVTSPRKMKRVKRVLSDSENEDKEEEDGGDREADTDVEEEEEEASVDALKFSGIKAKKKIQREFFENEAELSGSEAESDENLDLAEEEDILEEEEGDRDMAGVSEELLREQVGKVHMKQLQDADDRELMRYKEMYLQDGDLYTDGGGRMRNFRWKNADESSQQDMFANHSDHEQGEDDQEDAEWRKTRYEREKFLADSEQVAPSEDSQLLKLGQFLLKKKDSNTSSLSLDPPINQVPRQQPKPKLSKKGSFLSRGKEALVQLARVAKATLGGGKGRGKSQNFVFHTVEATTQEDQEPAMPQPSQPAKRKAHKPAQPEQAVKKQKVDATTPSKPLAIRQNSIFNLLE